MRARALLMLRRGGAAPSRTRITPHILDTSSTTQAALRHPKSRHRRTASTAAGSCERCTPARMAVSCIEGEPLRPALASSGLAACVVVTMLLCAVAPTTRGGQPPPPPRCLSGSTPPSARSGPARRITLELDNWASHEALTEAAKILLEEELGLEVAISQHAAGRGVYERVAMEIVDANVEVWP